MQGFFKIIIPKRFLDAAIWGPLNKTLRDVEFQLQKSGEIAM